MPAPATTSCASMTAMVPSPTASRRRSTATPERTFWVSAGAESLVGGDGDDVIDENGGADTGLMGAGDDTFVWDPGDGGDVVEKPGRRRHDAIQRRRRRRAGRPIGERQPSPVLPPQGAITMDTAGVERVDFNALGGADLDVNDLSGTDVATSASTSPAPSAAATATTRPTASSSTPPTTRTRSTSTETRPVSPSQACRRSWRFSTRSRPTSSTSTPSTAMTRSSASGLAAGAISLALDGDAGKDVLGGRRCREPGWRRRRRRDRRKRWRRHGAHGRRR